jgi:hypothetical protein
MGMEIQRQTTYDCRECIRNDWAEKQGRICFLPEIGDEVNDITISSTLTTKPEEVGEEGEILYKAGEVLLEVTPDVLLSEILPDALEVYSKMSTYDALKFLCKNVCPKSLLTAEVDEIIKMESFCREYHVPVHAGVGYLDYPKRIVDAFNLIGSARERVRAREMEEMKQGSGVK